MTTGPTPAQVAAHVAMVRRHRPEERVIGIHTPGGWLGGATLQVNGESCNVAYCSSGLQVREALVSLDEGRMPQGMGKAPHPNPLPEREGTEVATELLLIGIMPLDEAPPGLDVLAAVARGAAPG